MFLTDILEPAPQGMVGAAGKKNVVDLCNLVFYQVIIQNGWDQTARYRISSIQDNRLDVKFDHHSHQSPSERVLRTSRYPYHSTRYQNSFTTLEIRFHGQIIIRDSRLGCLQRILVVIVAGYGGMTPIHLPRCPKYS